MVCCGCGCRCGCRRRRRPLRSHRPSPLEGHLSRQIHLKTGFKTAQNQIGVNPALSKVEFQGISHIYISYLRSVKNRMQF